MLLLVVIPVFLCGALLVSLGRRGFRIDDHPICRRCSFDLIGRTAATEPICPECGASLTAHRAVRVGNRRHSRRATLAGTLLILLSFAGTGTVLVARSQAYNWNTFKPMWLLLREARGPQPGPALDEILRRIAGKGLSPKTLNTLAVEALALQGDHTKTWEPKWGDVVEVAHLAEALPDEFWRTYCDQAFTLTLSARSPVRVGDFVPLRVEQESRVGNGQLLGLMISAQPPSLGSLAGSIAPNPDPRYQLAPEPRPAIAIYANGQAWPSVSSGRPIWNVKPPDPDLKDIMAYVIQWPRAAAVGPVETSIELDIKISEHSYGDQVLPNRGPVQRPASTKTLVERSTTLRASTLVVPAGAMTVELSTGDVEVRQRVTEGIAPSTDRGAFRLEHFNGQGAAVYGQIEVRGLPIAIAFDVILKRGDKEWNVGHIARPPSERRLGLGFHNSVDGFEPGVVDVILRPSPDAARMEPDIYKIWGEELVFPKVEVTASDRR